MASSFQPAPFSLLPRTRAPWSEFALSSCAQAGLVVFLLWLRLLHPVAVSAPEHNFRSVQLVSAPAPVSQQAPNSTSTPVFVAKFDPPGALHLPTPQPKPAVKAEALPAPSISMVPKTLNPIPVKASPVIPRALNLFSNGSPAPPPVARPAEQVQTGGFGDPNGIPAKINPGKPVNIASLGSFDLPSGSGSGNGTGGSTGAHGAVASAGFGNSTSVAGNRPNSSNRQSTVRLNGFGEADIAATPAPQPHSQAPAAVVPAEILSKPAPVYTQEARNLRIEGEVLLEVVLGASGNLRVVRIVRGLGHGLDDTAVKAAEQIRFKPATRDGQPADSTVVLHIVFQLA